MLRQPELRLGRTHFWLVRQVSPHVRKRCSTHFPGKKINRVRKFQRPHPLRGKGATGIPFPWKHLLFFYPWPPKPGQQQDMSPASSFWIFRTKYSSTFKILILTRVPEILREQKSQRYGCLTNRGLENASVGSSQEIYLLMRQMGDMEKPKKRGEPSLP